MAAEHGVVTTYLRPCDRDVPVKCHSCGEISTPQGSVLIDGKWVPTCETCMLNFIIAESKE